MLYYQDQEEEQQLQQRRDQRIQVPYAMHRKTIQTEHILYQATAIIDMILGFYFYKYSASVGSECFYLWGFSIVYTYILVIFIVIKSITMIFFSQCLYDKEMIDSWVRIQIIMQVVPFLFFLVSFTILIYVNEPCNGLNTLISIYVIVIYAVVLIWGFAGLLSEIKDIRVVLYVSTVVINVILAFYFFKYAILSQTECGYLITFSQVYFIILMMGIGMKIMIIIVHGQNRRNDDFLKEVVAVPLALESLAFIIFLVNFTIVYFLQESCGQSNEFMLIYLSVGYPFILIVGLVACIQDSKFCQLQEQENIPLNEYRTSYILYQTTIIIHIILACYAANYVTQAEASCVQLVKLTFAYIETTLVYLSLKILSWLQCFDWFYSEKYVKQVIDIYIRIESFPVIVFLILFTIVIFQNESCGELRQFAIYLIAVHSFILICSLIATIILRKKK